MCANRATQVFYVIGAGQMGVELPTTKLDGVAWFVQISDLHLSKYDHLPERHKLYGDKLGDLRCSLLCAPFASVMLSECWKSA